MNALIFTDADAQTLIAYQSGQHRLAPVQLTDGRWFLMEDILTEIPDGLFGGKLRSRRGVHPYARNGGNGRLVEGGGCIWSKGGLSLFDFPIIGLNIFGVNN
jgi:hypothetical protein